MRGRGVYAGHVRQVRDAPLLLVTANARLRVRLYAVYAAAYRRGGAVQAHPLLSSTASFSSTTRRGTRQRRVPSAAPRGRTLRCGAWSSPFLDSR